MAVRNVRTEENPVLREKCVEVPSITDGIKRLINDMFETMYEFDGVGLAAPQIGIAKKIVVIDDRDGNKLALINPVITESRGEQISEEGCLSLPGFAGRVKRPEFVKVEALNVDGDEILLEAEGFLAIVLSHEIDHLDGILYKDKAFEFGKAAKR
ncbi:MAG: peptide deformylase [Clostridia bacterium]|nr:peptide deformylase [Clostridia bacterium]